MKPAMYFQLSALGKRRRGYDGEHLAEGLDDLRLGGAVVLDQGEDEGHGGVAHDGEAHDHGDDLGVLHGVGIATPAAGRDEGTRPYTVPMSEAKQSTSCVVEVLAAEKVLLLEVGAMASTHRARDQSDADGRRRGGRDVTEGEEHDARTRIAAESHSFQLYFLPMRTEKAIRG